MLELEKKIRIRDAEAHGLSESQKDVLHYAPPADFKRGWKELLRLTLTNLNEEGDDLVRL